MSTTKAVFAEPHWDEPVLAGFNSRLRATALSLRRSAGTTLFRNGDKVNRMFYVRSGEALMHRTTPSGMPVVLQRTSRGFIAEASLTSSTYHCDAVCRSQCDLIVFPVRALREAIDSDEGTRWAWIGLLSAQSRQLRTRVERFALKSISARLRHLLLTEGVNGAYKLRGNRKELAAELGVSPEALYRTLAALQSKGTLSIRGTCLRWREAAS